MPKGPRGGVRVPGQMNPFQSVGDPANLWKTPSAAPLETQHSGQGAGVQEQGREGCWTEVTHTAVAQSQLSWECGVKGTRISLGRRKGSNRKQPEGEVSFGAAWADALLRDTQPRAPSSAARTAPFLPTSHGTTLTGTSARNTRHCTHLNPRQQTLFICRQPPV